MTGPCLDPDRPPVRVGSLGLIAVDSYRVHEVTVTVGRLEHNGLTR
jgi:hypothetical protein